MSASNSAIKTSPTDVLIFNIKLLLGGTIHELRNPVFAMGVTVDALEKRLGETSEIKPYFAALRHELDRILQLAHELGDLIAPINQCQVFSIKELIMKVISDLNSLAQSKEVSVTTNIDENLKPVFVDISRLQIALQRLIGLSIIRTPKGEEVKLKIVQHEDDHKSEIQIDIKDNGPLLDPRAMRDVLLPFGIRRGGKLSLDVAIAYTTILAHNGTMSAHNDKLKGLCFTVRLPNVVGDIAP
ncbi:MAG: HAMP domain-containing histidine kinase [Deltaproteobacteria bacterium]|nr:HAMP domain-containing histidine kinase [Deltaproteobacteria bacterium]